MKYIQQLLNKIFALFYKQSETIEKKETELNKDSKIVCGVSFDYFTNQTIAIELLMGSLYDTNNIKFAETFANFIYHITQPTFRQTILDNIKNSSNTPEETLFYQNVIFNIALLEMYKKENSHTKEAKEPVVRPLAVFNR